MPTFGKAYKGNGKLEHQTLGAIFDAYKAKHGAEAMPKGKGTCDRASLEKLADISVYTDTFVAATLIEEGVISRIVATGICSRQPVETKNESLESDLKSEIQNITCNI